ncbi:hypothetical protein J5J86_16365 [Aquabacter sp. L1I39]|uniref:hypothetical protein n=1 Tax=Aquabacter sp. L1I39 TaxID=2820278 RepID=UPI001AD9EF80|nr:hypothetical protein [Aquabacter sp. L1I39]QTL02360.1 hypothetical protein J5J86_16365 [Aquabacter sp. L1I39]
MNSFLTTLRAAGLIVAGGVAAAILFALLGSLLVAAGIVLAVAVVAGGLHFLIFGRGKMKVHVERYQASPGGYEMIDITPPRPPRRPRNGEAA